MDDDPEPNLEQVILDSSPKNEQVISADEFQKFNHDSSEDTNADMTQHQESGDTGPFLEQEVLKKVVPSKVVPETVPEKQKLKSKDRRDSSLRRQERMEQSQRPDASGSVKSPTAPPRKPPRRSLQRLSGQESRRSSQQSVGQSPQSPKHSRSPSRKEVSIIENTWTNDWTNKVVKPRTVQKSRIWEPRRPSEAVGSSSEDLEKTDNTNTEEEFIHCTWDTTETDEEAFKNLSAKRAELEDVLWISQRPSRTMKSQTQQTSFIWDQNAVSEILVSSSEESQNSQETEETGFREGNLASFGEPDDLQSAEKPKKRGRPKAEDSQKTDSVKKTLLDQSQQTDAADDMNFRSEVPLKPQYGNRERVELKSHVNSPKSVSQPLLKSKHWNGGQKEPENEPIEPVEKSALAKTTGEEATLGNMWISRKTGKIVRNQIQQTDRSWLQYLVGKMHKVKRCRSQQTDESFLQRYSSIKMKRDTVGDLSKSVHTEPHGLSSCESDMETSEMKFVEFEVMSLGGELAKSAPDQEVLTSEGEVQQPIDDQGAVKLEQWPEESGSQTTLDDDFSYVEGFDAFQQTYSLISLEEGIWMNRKTGKLLISQVQQTSITSLPGSKTSLTKVIDEEVDGCFRLTVTRANESLESVKQVKRRATLPRTEPEAEEPASQASEQGKDRESHVILVKALGPDQLSEDVEVQMSRHLSEAMLLSTDSAFTELAPTDIYSTISFQDGIFLNTKTGRQLSSQSQQTEEPFETIFKDCLKITKVLEDNQSLTTRLNTWVEPSAAELKAMEEPVEVKEQPSSDDRRFSEAKKNLDASSDSQIIPESKKNSDASNESRIISESKKTSKTSSESRIIPESKKNSKPSSDSQIIPESKKNSDASSDSRIISESKKTSKTSSESRIIPESKKPSKTSIDSQIIPESKKTSKTSIESRIIPGSKKPSKTSIDSQIIPESKKPSKTSIDSQIIPESKKPSKTSIDSQIILESRKPSKTSIDSQIIPESKKTSKTSIDSQIILESKKPSKTSIESRIIPESKKTSKPSIDSQIIPESKKNSDASSESRLITESKKTSKPSSESRIIPESKKHSKPSSESKITPESRKTSEPSGDTPKIPLSRKTSESGGDTPKTQESKKNSESSGDTPKIPESSTKSSEQIGDLLKFPEFRKHSEPISEPPQTPDLRKDSESIGDTPRIPENPEPISDHPKIPESRKNTEPSGDSPKIPESKKNSEPSSEPPPIPERRRNTEPNREDAESCPSEGMDDDPASKHRLEAEDSFGEEPLEEPLESNSSLEPHEEEEQGTGPISEPSSEVLLACAPDGMDDDPSRRHRRMSESTNYQ